MLFVKSQKKPKGTQNFEAVWQWLMMKGISDPRELIVDKGRAFIPQGKGRVVAIVKEVQNCTQRLTRR